MKACHPAQGAITGHAGYGRSACLEVSMFCAGGPQQTKFMFHTSALRTLYAQALGLEDWRVLLIVANATNNEGVVQMQERTG